MRKRGRGTLERYINRLPLARPQLGTWPTTWACALTGNLTSSLLRMLAGAPSTEPHQPECAKPFLMKNSKVIIEDTGNNLTITVFIT